MIKPKEKPCKGEDIAKGYGCGKMTKYRKYGLGKMCCLSSWYLESENGKIKLEKTRLKIEAPRKEFESYKKERKSRQNLPNLIKNTVIAVHRYVRLRDKGKSCISCDTPYKDNFQAGHYFKAELYSSLKFDLDNIHGQCEQCNLRREGNESGYSLRLPKRIGQKAFDSIVLKAIQEKKTGFKWDKEELVKIRKRANKLFNELAKTKGNPWKG